MARQQDSRNTRRPTNRRTRRKTCRFCADKIDFIDYKNTNALRAYITDRGKILARRVTGNCAKHQRRVVASIKRSRNIALLPFTKT